MRAHIGGFVLHILLLLVLFLAMIDNIFLFRGKIFWLEILVVAGLVVISAVSVGKYANKGSSRTLLFVYGTGLINVIVLSIVATEVFWSSLVISVVGVLLSMRKKEDSLDEVGGEVRVEEITPEPMSPELFAGVNQPIVESRLLSEKMPAKRRKAKKKTKRKAKRERKTK